LKYFTRIEVESISQATKCISCRWLFRFLFRTGARISEAIDISLSDISRDHIVLRTSKQRGKKLARIIPVEPRFLQSLVKWKGKLPGSIDFYKPVWPASRQWYHQALKKSLAPSDNRALHAFRHGFAKACLDDGVDLRDLQRYLGHSSINVTTKYLTITEDYLSKLQAVDFEPAQLLLYKSGKL
jgi:integrase/recombinase XerD